MKLNLSYKELQKRGQLLKEEADKRKRTQIKLEESEARFRDIAENALAWTWEVDATGKFTYSSSVVKNILGYDPKEILGKYFYDFFHPDEREKLKKAALKIFVYKKPFRKFINQNVSKNCNTVILSTSGVPIIGAQGDLKGYRGGNLDKTDQYIAHKALQESEKHMRSLLESAVGFAIYRLAFNKDDPYKLSPEFVSPSIKDILGVEPGDFSSGTFFKQIHPEDLHRVEEANERGFETNRFDVTCRYYNSKEKKWIWIHAISTGVRNDENIVTHVNGILIDVTERQEALERIKAHEQKLMKKTEDLKEMNVALNVLIKKRTQDELAIQDRTLLNIKKLVLPYISRIKRTNLDDGQLKLLDIVKSNLMDITSAFSNQVTSKHNGLTPTELRIGDLVRQGKRNKQIAEILGVTRRTIETHRQNIRKKLGINNKKINLQTHLISMG